MYEELITDFVADPNNNIVGCSVDQVIHKHGTHLDDIQQDKGFLRLHRDRLLCIETISEERKKSWLIKSWLYNFLIAAGEEGGAERVRTWVPRSLLPYQIADGNFGKFF